MRWLWIVLLGACTQVVEPNYTQELLHAHEVSIVLTQQSQYEVQQELEGYVQILRNIAELPPINDEVSNALAFSIAASIYTDSQLTGLPGTFYLGLIRVENPQLEPYICNWYGACGLTQVVPKYWVGAFPECGDDLLRNIYTQICYGARVYLYYHSIWQDETLALYAYNGCTQELQDRNARCKGFPEWVQTFAADYEEELND